MTYGGLRVIGLSVLLSLAACGLAACGGAQEPPFEIHSLRVFAPLPGSDASVAYLTIVNNSNEELNFPSVESPEFARAELHETVLEDGVMRMRALDELIVPAHDSLELREGGKHIMLLDPRSKLELDQTVTLVLKESGGAESVLRTSLTSRVAVASFERASLTR